MHLCGESGTQHHTPCLAHLSLTWFPPCRDWGFMEMAKRLKERCKKSSSMYFNSGQKVFRGLGFLSALTALIPEEAGGFLLFIFLMEDRLQRVWALSQVCSLFSTAQRKVVPAQVLMSIWWCSLGNTYISGGWHQVFSTQAKLSLLIAWSIFLLLFCFVCLYIFLKSHFLRKVDRKWDQK